MPRKCTVCQHERLSEINQALVTGRSLRHIASQFRVGYKAVERHSKNHLPASLVKAKEASEVANADGLLGQVCDLRDRTLDILSEAETTGKLSVALRAIQVAQGNIELLARLLIEIERHRLEEDAKKPSPEEERRAQLSTEELEKHYFVIKELRCTVIEEAIEEIEKALASPADLNAKEIEDLQRERDKFVRERDRLIENIDFMRWSLKRQYRKEGENHE